MNNVERRILKEKVWRRDRLKCRYCGAQLLTPPKGEPNHDPRYATVDHVVSRAKGGPTTLGNLVTACIPCNHAKGDKHPLEFRLGRIDRSGGSGA